jgi:hypothetical protein
MVVLCAGESSRLLLVISTSLIEAVGRSNPVNAAALTSSL